MDAEAKAGAIELLNLVERMKESISGVDDSLAKVAKTLETLETRTDETALAITDGIDALNESLQLIAAKLEHIATGDLK